MSTETRRTVRTVLLLAVATILVGVGIYFAARTRPPELTAPRKNAEPAPVVASPAETPKPVAATAAPATREVVVTDAPVVPTPVENRLSGLWEVRVDSGSGVYEPVARVRIGEADGELNATVEANGESGAARITFVGMKVHLTHAPNPQAQYTYDGTMNPAYTQADGTIETVFAQQDTTLTEARETYPAQLVRVTGAMLAQERDAVASRAKREGEARALIAALRAFADQNNGRYPSLLTQLPVGNLPDPSLITNTPGRVITYYGGSQIGADPARIAAVTQEFAGKERSRENLMEKERRLHEVWGSAVPAQPSVFRIEYSNPPLTIAVPPNGSLHVIEPAAGNQGEAEAQRNSEFNNLKQLMLVIKMFENENDMFLPGGWLSVYPEYLADPNVLHSPWASEGTLSYDLLFPGATEKELYALAQKLVEAGSITPAFPPEADPTSPMWESLVSSIVPIVVGQDELPADSGRPAMRAVAFLDGHVEAVAVSDWDTRIAPFLK